MGKNNHARERGIDWVGSSVAYLKPKTWHVPCTSPPVFFSEQGWECLVGKWGSKVFSDLLRRASFTLFVTVFRTFWQLINALIKCIRIEDENIHVCKGGVHKSTMILWFTRKIMVAIVAMGQPEAKGPIKDAYEWGLAPTQRRLCSVSELWSAHSVTA